MNTVQNVLVVPKNRFYLDVDIPWQNGVDTQHQETVPIVFSNNSLAAWND